MRLFRETLYAGGQGVDRVLRAPIVSSAFPAALYGLCGQALRNRLIAVFRS